MKKHKLLAFILLGTVLVSCGDKEIDKKNLFSIEQSGLKATYQPQESLSLVLNNDKNKTIDSIAYYINEKRVGGVKGNNKFDFPLADSKLGYQQIKAIVYYEGQNAETDARIEVVSNVKPKLLSYTILNTYPHDETSYTQGLEFYRDTLFEGTGQRGTSKLLKTDYKTGKAYQSVNLEGKYFGEGITILNNKVYQLTWQENTGFIYNADNLKQIRTFNYFKNIEGWGLCNDGKQIYQSDGTEKIWVLDPETMKETDYINVYSESSKIKAVNELEWVNGKIYGNVYQKDAVAVINPKTGAVEGIIDLRELKTKVNMMGHDLGNDVLNGLAYNPKTKTLFVTGKRWNKMFEIKVSE
ncbi:MAG: glutaminyl-peptide cyclotransferase [Flavobacterium sp.]|nr:glutaminyl-peptide cyclotransferase [Flavobacterium sp.]PZO22701.1 MAG: glutamine cyclotransferase [Flavobacteriaceae bacterium]